MTRTLALLALSLAALAWLLRRPSWPGPAWDEPEDGIQPADPVTTRPVVVTLPSSMTVAEVGHIRMWLDAHPEVLSELYESRPVISTQSGPLGPSA